MPKPETLNLSACPLCENKDIKIEYTTHQDGNKGYATYCYCCDLEQFTCCDEDAYGEHESVEKWNTRKPELEELKNNEVESCVRDSFSNFQHGVLSDTQHKEILEQCIFFCVEDIINRFGSPKRGEK